MTRALVGGIAALSHNGPARVGSTHPSHHNHPVIESFGVCLVTQGGSLGAELLWLFDGRSGRPRIFGSGTGLVGRDWVNRSAYRQFCGLTFSRSMVRNNLVRWYCLG
ncbi:hypothetical protein Ssi03_31860 [Sphaerisporangium siamense]|nr:hypothetical protein Ssi03_31860 [Sphaerisporangium siamense]